MPSFLTFYESAVDRKKGREAGSSANSGFWMGPTPWEWSTPVRSAVCPLSAIQGLLSSLARLLTRAGKMLQLFRDWGERCEKWPPALPAEWASNPEFRRVPEKPSHPTCKPVQPPEPASQTHRPEASFSAFAEENPTLPQAAHCHSHLVFRKFPSYFALAPSLSLITL